MSAFDSVDALKSAIREGIESYDASRHTRTRERGRLMTTADGTARTFTIHKYATGSGMFVRWNVSLTGMRGPKSFRTQAEADAWIERVSAAYRANGDEIVVKP